MRYQRHLRLFSRSVGVTLFEMLVVLVIIGMMLMLLANYKRREATQVNQQTTANVIAREIAGVMGFIKQKEFESDNGSWNNPLYKSSTGTYQSPYNLRNKGTLQDAVNNTGQYFSDWSGLKTTPPSTTSQSRRLFLGKECKPQGELPRKLMDNPLTCEMANNQKVSDFILQRVDFINNETDPTQADQIDRVDFYLLSQPGNDDEQWNFLGYANPLMKALQNEGLSYLQAVVVRSTSTDDRQFALVEVNNKPLELSQAAANLHDLARQYSANTRLGVRISLSKTSAEVTADGETPVDKLCWNTKSNTPGPCISAQDNERLVITSDESSTTKEAAMCWDKGTGLSTLCLTSMSGQGSNTDQDNSDDRVLHLRTSDITASGESHSEQPSSIKGTTATLYANVVMENTARKHAAQWRINDVAGSRTFTDMYGGQYELVTPATVFYQAFNNTSVIEFTGVNGEAGAIQLPVQRCPKVEAKPSKETGIEDYDAALKGIYYRQLYPRMTVAISSVSAENSPTEYMDYSLQGKTRKNTMDNPAVGGLGGVALQVNLVIPDNIAKKIAGQPAKDRTPAEYGAFVSNAAWGSFDDYLYTNELFNLDSENSELYHWIISATSAAIDINGGGINKINPRSLSVIVTQWCSTIPQSGVISDINFLWMWDGPWYMLDKIESSDTATFEY